MAGKASRLVCNAVVTPNSSMPNVKRFKNKEKTPVAPPVPPKASNKDSIVEVIELVEDVPEPPKPMIIEVVEDIPEPSKVEEIIAVEAIDIQNPQRPTHQIYINNEKSIKELIKDYNDQLKKVNALLPEGYPMAYLNLKEEEQDEIKREKGKIYEDFGKTCREELLLGRIKMINIFYHTTCEGKTSGRLGLLI